MQHQTEDGGITQRVKEQCVRVVKLVVGRRDEVSDDVDKVIKSDDNDVHVVEVQDPGR